MTNWEASVAFLFGIITLIFFYNAYNINEKEHPALRAFFFLIGFLFINVDIGIALEIVKANGVSDSLTNLFAAIWGLSWIMFGFVFMYFLIMMYLLPTVKWFIDTISGVGK